MQYTDSTFAGVTEHGMSKNYRISKVKLSLYKYSINTAIKIKEIMSRNAGISSKAKQRVF